MGPFSESRTKMGANAIPTAPNRRAGKARRTTGDAVDGLLVMGWHGKPFALNAQRAILIHSRDAHGLQMAHMRPLFSSAGACMM